MQDSDRAIAQSHIDLEERIRRRAHEIYLGRRQNGGGDKDAALEDWLQAERDVLGNDAHQPAQDRGTTVGNAHRPGARSVDRLGEA